LGSDQDIPNIGNLRMLYWEKQCDLWVMRLMIINNKSFRLFVNLLGVVLSVGYVLMVNYFWLSNRDNAFDQSLMFGFLICFVFINYQYFFGIIRNDPEKRKKNKESMVTAWISLILLIFVLFIWGRVKF
jgi:hypothetical protein